MRMTTIAVPLSLALSATPPPAAGQASDMAAFFGLAAGAASLVSAGVDIARAPESARLTNQRAGVALIKTLDLHGGGVGLMVSVPMGGPRAPAAKSPETALGASLTATLAPLALGTAGIALAHGNDDVTLSTISALVMTGGVVVGPAVGHWYAGRPDRATFGLVLRSVLIGGGALGVLAALAYDLED